MHLRNNHMTFDRHFIKRYALASLIPLLALGAMFAIGRPAQAQLNTQTVVVLDFDVTPGYDPILGRKAADALAVELQRENEFKSVTSQKVEIVPRQRLGQIITENAGLIAPYTRVVQSRLGQIAGASRIYSGRIMSVLVSDHRMARVTVEVRVLDVPTNTYINGAVASQQAISINSSMDNDLLVDQAINKAVYAALQEISSKPLPLGTVQNVRVGEMYLNLGTKNGVLRGQRYAVIRPLYRGRDSQSRDVVESTRVAEIIITKAEMDQSIATVIAGGGAGVKTGDKVHLIYIPAIMPGKNPDLRRTDAKYLTTDEIAEVAAVQESRRLELEAEQRRKDLRRAEEKARKAQKQAKRRR